ncbi:hypothetical protein H4696_000296 [Amycolatopsis lexingtonensis]|uniref:Uncharacterized protein n=1 Tax=Amycolatopsis lexingtonensis TaxID=218822 RepID=A0ABR9HQJ4_9PSEU|nr:hypothetical protein [Amycolatopsis lexingtonensis]MBE1493196.1 hypothetical protein [Amycolatopsis lexingtonensis]
MPATAPSTPDTTPTLTWLWQRKPDSTDLEKALIPTHLIPAGWLPSLQHRYAEGDRVDFAWDGKHQPGTVVQDQGMYLAIIGERPGSGFTIHKTDVRPQDAEPAAPADPVIVSAIDPDPHPVVHRDGHTATVHWNLGRPSVDGWLPWARLHIAFQPDIGFVATLSSVEELDRAGRHRERLRPLDPVVVHHHPTRRPSHHAVRTCLRDAIDIVIAAAGQRQPVVCAHFVPILAAIQEK